MNRVIVSKNHPCLPIGISFVIIFVLIGAVFFHACTSSLQQVGTDISDSIEAPLAKSLASSVIEQTPIVEDPIAQAYVDSLCKVIGKNSGRSDLEYQAWIVDSDDINAFTVGGGYLFFNKGLIARSRNESELVGVIAHEIGHNVGRHLTKKLVTQLGLTIATSIALGKDPGQTRQIAGALLGVGGGLLALHFSRENESEADSLGVEEMLATGIHPSGLPSFFGVLRDFYGDRGGIEQYFAQHPPLGHRIANTKRIIETRDPESAHWGPLSTDSRRFRAIRERMRWLTRYVGTDTFTVAAGERKAFSADADFKEADNISVWLDIKVLEGSPKNIRVVVTDSTGLERLKKGNEPRKSDFVKTVTSELLKIPLENQRKYAIVFDNSISRSSEKRIIVNASFRYKAL